MTKQSEKWKIEYEMRDLIRDARNDISDEKVLKITNKLEEYNKLKERLKNCKNNIEAPKRITDKMLLDSIDELLDNINTYAFDDLSSYRQTEILNKIIRKCKLLRRFYKNNQL